MSKRIYLNEDWMDRVTSADLDATDSRDVEKEIESTDGERGTHCLHFYPRESQFITLPLKKRQKYTLQRIIDNARALENVRVG